MSPRSAKRSKRCCPSVTAWRQSCLSPFVPLPRRHPYAHLPLGCCVHEPATALGPGRIKRPAASNAAPILITVLFVGRPRAPPDISSAADGPHGRWPLPRRYVAGGRITEGVSGGHTHATLWRPCRHGRTVQGARRDSDHSRRAGGGFSTSPPQRHPAGHHK